MQLLSSEGAPLCPGWRATDLLQLVQGGGDGGRGFAKVQMWPVDFSTICHATRDTGLVLQPLQDS